MKKGVPFAESCLVKSITSTSKITKAKLACFSELTAKNLSVSTGQVQQIYIIF